MQPRANEETFVVRDDVKDPSGQSDLRGVEMGVNLNGNMIARPSFRWKNRITEVDVYTVGETSLMLHFYCPQCTHALRVTTEQKEIRFIPQGGAGRLSIAAFRCTWAQCGLHIRVVDNVAQDVR